MDIFAFTDIHGEKILFDKIYNWLNGRSNPWKCYFLGDACDRSPFGYEIIKRLLDDKRFVYIKGNHEEMFVQAALALKNEWSHHQVSKEELFNSPENYIWDYHYLPEVSLHIENGGFDTLIDWVKEGAPMHIIEKLSNLPEHIILPHEVWGILDLSHSGHLMDESDGFIWSREHFHEKWESGRMIHGHTPVRSLMKQVLLDGPANIARPAFYQEGTKIDLDTACFLSDTITVLNLETFEQHRFTTLI